MTAQHSQGIVKFKLALSHLREPPWLRFCAALQELVPYIFIIEISLLVKKHGGNWILLLDVPVGNVPR